MFKRLVSMFIGGMCAVGASQAPEFAQQYTQRLGGAVDELKLVVGQFDRDAAAVGLSRAGGLHRLEKSDDRFVTYRGKSMRTTVERFEMLSRHHSNMQAHDVLSRVTEMVSNFDRPVATLAKTDFRPAMPMTAEGLFSGLVGFIGGALGGGILAGLVKSLFLRRKVRTARQSNGELKATS
jgi:Protein of unknown function (DUF2937)